MPLSAPKHKSSAKTVDGSLVLSLPDALTPVVMRLDLEDAKSATLGVEEKSGNHVLVIKTSNKEQQDIAAYQSREEAVNALMAASAALEKGSRTQTFGNAPANDHGGQRGTGAWKWVGAFAVLVFLIYLVASGGGNPRFEGSPRATQGAPAAQGGNFGAPASGVPQSADAFLSGR
jgi:hypothetical protein